MHRFIHLDLTHWSHTFLIVSSILFSSGLSTEPAAWGRTPKTCQHKDLAQSQATARYVSSDRELVRQLKQLRVKQSVTHLSRSAVYAQGYIHGVVKAREGWWLIKKLAPAPNPDCAPHTVDISRGSPVLFRVYTSNAAAANECSPDLFTWRHILFDDRAGLITAQHQVSRGEEFDLKLEIRDRALTSKSEALSLSLDTLARCAATAQRSSNQWLSKARKSYQKKRYELAVSQYLSATYANANNAYAFAETGLALLKLKDERAALNIFKAAHKLKLKSGKAQRKYSAALYYNEALSHLALAERAQQSAERLDHVQAAVTALTSSLRLRPSKSVEAKLKKAQIRLEGLQDASSKLCEELKSYRGITPKTYPSLDQFTQSTMKMSSAQALKRGEVERPHERILLTWDVWDQDRAVTWVDDQGRAHSFGALFFTSRGHGCGWDSEFTTQLHPNQTWLTTHSLSAERDGGECHFDGELATTTLVIDHKLKRPLHVFSCWADKDKPRGLTRDGDLLVWRCGDKRRRVSIAELSACYQNAK